MALANEYRWDYRPGHELSLLRGDALLLRYHLATNQRKPFIHPLNTAGGLALTAFEPSDHVWHRGLWFSWKYLNGVNYWEETVSGAEDGRTEFAGGESVEFRDDLVGVVADYRYRPPGVGKEPILEETRATMIGLPDERGLQRIDFTHTFTAKQQDVTIDRTPICPQTPWGGYAGLSWRMARTLVNFKALNSEGHADKQVEHQRARWADISGLSDGGRDVYAGLAMFDHPSNPRHPTHWRCILDAGFGYLNPALVMNEPLTLAAGERLGLRYRVVAHDGRMDAGQLQIEYDRYAQGR